MNHELNITYALFILRVVAGVLFFFQGYDKIFKVKIDGVVVAFRDSIKRTIIAPQVLKIAVIITSWIEFVAGFTLMFGIFRDISLYLLGIDLIMVAIAFSSMRAMWDLQYFFPRLLLIVSLLLLPAELDRWSLDFFLRF